MECVSGVYEDSCEALRAELGGTRAIAVPDRAQFTPPADSFSEIA